MLILIVATCWTTFVFISMLKSHSHTLTLSLPHTLSLSHSFNLSFNHSRHAEQVLFSSLCWKLTVYCWKLQCFFLDLIIIITLSPDIRVHRAGSQLKNYFGIIPHKLLPLLPYVISLTQLTACLPLCQKRVIRSFCHSELGLFSQLKWKVYEISLVHFPHYHHLESTDL